MKISESFPSKYLRANDLNGHTATVCINRVEVEDVGGNGKLEDQKPVIYFEGRQKGLVLNKTNATVLQQTLGDDTSAWVGKTIELFPTETTFGGNLVPCIRLRVPSAGSGVQQDIRW